MDEHTPHIHATVVPIVTGERRKARKKQTEGRRTYHKKANAVRLCADDLLTRERLVAYHDSYAAVMAKYGLQRGIRGSEARHTTTAQYYRDLKRQTGELEANVRQLQTEQRQAEQQLDEVRKEIKSEKLEAAKTEAKAALVAKVGSLLGSGKLKGLEADNRTLQGEVAARDESIELLQQQMERQQVEHDRQLMELQVQHRKEMADKEAEHQREVSFLKSKKPRNGFRCSKSWCTWRSSASKSASTKGRPPRLSAASRCSTRANSIRRNTDVSSRPRGLSFKW